MALRAPRIKRAIMHGMSTACKIPEPHFRVVPRALMEAERHGLKARRLSLCNSGDTAGPRDRVVG